MESHIIGVRFQKIGKIYHFDATKYPDIQPGDFVVVETSRGMQLGEVTQKAGNGEAPRDSSLKPITRKANPRDLVLRQVWNRREEEAVEVCRQGLSSLKIEGVKIVSSEYTLDGKRLTILYTSEGDERVDLSDLDREIKNLIPRTRIEFRQIGPRDAAKIIGGMGACGLPNRCCSKFLVEFSPISIRMAKAQGVSLSPTEITGMCGRLRCCLVYEYDHYVEARKELPKEKRRVSTPMGEGKVVSVYPLVRRILVDLGEAGFKEFDVDELRGPVEKTDAGLASPPVQESPEQSQKPQNTRSTRENSRRKGKRRR